MATKESQVDWSGVELVVGGVVVGNPTSTKTASATAGAATLSTRSGIVTSEAITTAAGATYTLTLTNTLIAVGSQVLVTLGKGTATTGVPVISTVTCTANTLTVVVQNIHASAALNGTITFTYVIF